MDAFTARLGISEGRLAGPDGSIVLVLGDLEPARFHNLAPGDHAEIAQTTDLTGVELVRVRGTFRAPARGRWSLGLRVAGIEVASLGSWPGRTRTVTDLSGNVSGVVGPVEVAVRLTFVGPS